MKKFRKYLSLAVCSVLSITMFSSNAYAINANKSTYSNGITYRWSSSDSPAFIIPFYDSQSLHQKGYTTTIGVTQTRTNTVTASASLTTGVDAFFANTSATFGLSYSASVSIGTSTTYTIPSSTPTGRYRIDSVFPVNTVTYSKYTDEGSRIFFKVIKNTPRPIDKYYKLTRYSN